jgi:TolB protein
MQQEPPTIELSGVRLRPLRPEDADAWHAYLSDPAVTELTSYPEMSLTHGWAELAYELAQPTVTPFAAAGNEEMIMGKSYVYAVGLLAILLFVSAVARSDSSRDQVSASPVRITSGPQGEYEPQWSPDGSMLSYGSGKMGDQNLAVMKLDSGKETFLTEGLSFLHATTWSPDGRSIAYVTGSATESGFVSHVYIVNVKDKSVRQLTHEESIDGSPSWSPDGKAIAFPSERSGAFNIWIQRVDGSEATMVTDHPEDDHGPEWSPDGKAIAFHSRRGGSSSIWIHRLEDGGLTQLTGDEYEEQYPDWSPDGRFVVFDSNRSGNMDIWLQPVIGGEPIQVTSDPAMDMRPSWSPDGKRIAFSSDRGGSMDVWVVDVPRSTRP